MPINTSHLWKYTRQIKSPKQKAVFIYLNNFRRGFEERKDTFYDALGSVKYPFSKIEIDHVVGELSKEQFIEVQFWLNVLDAIITMDNRLVYNFIQLISFIKETIYLEFADNLVKVEKIRKKMEFDYISAQYTSYIKVIFLNLLNVFALNKIMNDPFDVGKDLSVSHAMSSLFKTEDIFNDFVLSFIDPKNTLHGMYSLKTICTREKGKLKLLLSDTLRVFKVVLLQFDLRITDDQIKQLTDYSDKELDKLIFA